MSLETPEKKENWVKRNARKIITGGALTLASLVPHEGHTQTLSSEKDTTVYPTKEWTYQEGDKDYGVHQSKKYPGFVEYFGRNIYKGSTDTNAYTFTGYMTEDQIPIDPPEVTEQKIIEKEIELTYFVDPEEWAKNRFEFQKTDAFKQEIDSSFVASLQEQIEAGELMERKVDTTTPDPSVPLTVGGVEGFIDLRSPDQKYGHAVKELNGYKNHKEEWLPLIVQQETKTYEQLVAEAKSRKSEIEQKIKKLRKEKEETLRYIQEHSTKK